MKDTKAKANPGLADVNKTAISTTFPQTRLLAQFEKMANAVGDKEANIELMSETAYVVCDAARTFCDKSTGTGKGQTNENSLILDAWRGHWKMFIAQLKTANSPFVKDGTPNKAGETKPVMTGYGRNVASTARGVIEYDIPTHDANKVPASYREIDKAVKEARKDAQDETKKALRLAKETLSESLKVFRSNLGSDLELILTAVEVIECCRCEQE